MRKLVQGYLLEARQPVSKDVFPVAPSIQLVRLVESTAWEEYIYRSSIPLREEDQLSLGGHFEYGLLCRRSGARVLIVSDTTAVVDAVVKQEVASGGMRLRRVTVAVDPLVKYLARAPQRYVLTRVDALMDAAYGENLRSVSFYGMDVGSVSFFREHVGLMQCYSCGLRDAGSRGEILRLSNRGMVAFQYSGATRLIEVERVLAFVRRTAGVKEPVTEMMQETSDSAPEDL